MWWLVIGHWIVCCYLTQVIDHFDSIENTFFLFFKTKNSPQPNNNYKKKSHDKNCWKIKLIDNDSWELITLISID